MTDSFRTDGPAEGAAPPRPTYSVTSLMVYELCPQQYYSTFVRRIPPPVTPAMRRGTDIHKLIADLLTSVQPSLFAPDVEPEVAAMLNTWRTSRFNQSPVVVEERFSRQFAGGDVRGRIDVVLPQPNGGLEVVDFKSGTRRTRAELGKSLQLPLYALAIGDRFGLAPEQLAYTYYFLRPGEEERFVPSAADFESLTTRIDGLIAGIQRGYFKSAPGCTCFACRRLRSWRQRGEAIG